MMEYNASRNMNIHGINDIKTKDQLNSIAEVFEQRVISICQLSKFAKPKKVGPNAQKTSLIKDKNSKSEIQGLYKSQQHRAVQEILFGPSTYCQIADEIIEKQYRSLLSEKQECDISKLPSLVWQNIAPNKKHNSLLCNSFTPKEVKAKLLAKIRAKLSNSRSVGLDRIRFANLIQSDPNCENLAALFNACLQLKTIPDIWRKRSYAVLIKDKEGASMEIKNWRSITMHSTISKLFQSLLASRLIIWTKNTNRLSTTQKSLLLYNAACESSFILQECKIYSQKKGKDLAVAWLNFSNVADSIPQAAILHALQRHALPDSFHDVIKNCIQNVEVQIRTFQGFTNSISILKGLPQGAPLNPILIDLIVEPILKRLAMEDKFEIFNQMINHFAIPYELVLVAESDAKLQNLLQIVEKTTKDIGFQFNINKCLTVHCDSKDNVKETKFSFFGQKLAVLSKDEVNKHFGVKQGLSIGQDGVPTISEMIDSINAIDASLLHNFQKLESIQTYVMPRVENCLRGLQEYDKSVFEQVDKLLKDKIKMWLDLPHDMTEEERIVLQVSKLNNNCKENYLPFLDLFYIMKIVHACKMFSSEDKIVENIAIDSLTAEISESIKKKAINKEVLSGYLSGELPVKSKQLNSIWKVVREGTLSLKSKINLKWRYHNDEMQLIIKRKNKKAIVLGDQYQCDVEGYLKKYLVEFYINIVTKKDPDAVKNATAAVAAIRPAKFGYRKMEKRTGDEKNSQVSERKEPPAIVSTNYPALY